MIYAVDKDGFLLGYGKNKAELAMLSSYASTTTVQPTGNFTKPQWDGKGWVEGATADELAAIANAQAQSNQPTAEQQAINQLGVMVASLAAKVVSK
jgi:hypothetical protein